MTLFNQAIMGYFKPRFLLDDRSRCAYEFMDSHECLMTITDNDICWNTVENLINEY
jgi:hypothetical protein